MSTSPLPDPAVLANATPAQLEQAAADNHRQLFSLEAMAVRGAIQTAGGLTWTYAGPDNTAMVPFPSLEKDEAGPALDAMMDWFRAHPPRNAGCWSLNPTRPDELGVKLLARGFQPGWSPCWMALDLSDTRQHPSPAALQIRPDNTTPTHTVTGLPYAGNDGAVSPALMQAFPSRAQRFLGWMSGRIVAQVCVLYSDGPYGVAGIYNMGVVPEMRQQGIGKALLLAACRDAKERGYHYATLNGTGRRMYEQAGFRWIGNGHTWWLNNRRYLTHPPSPERVALAEAIGLGDMAELDRIGAQFDKSELNAPMNNGMSLIEHAIHCRQFAAAAWLAGRGVTYTALEAWDLGWRDRAADLLAAQPAEVDRLYGYLQYTLLHVAAERGDTALAKLALSARPNLEIKDKIYHSTPAGWAQFFNREKILQMIDDHKRV
jgi:GNAT superfamily N-acetyltransferase